MKKLFLAVFFLISCAAFPALAQLPARDVELQACSPTPSVSPTNYPGEENIVSSNRLARPAGKAEFAGTQVVYISGRLTDEHCLPVSGAVIDIWQAGPDGAYRYPGKAQLISPYPLFAGSGRTRTDNLGRYNFVTLMPGGNAPHIYFRVRQEDFPIFTTAMYFSGDVPAVKEKSSKKAKKTKKAKKAESHKGLVAITAPRSDQRGTDARFDITLRGRAQYKKF